MDSQLKLDFCRVQSYPFIHMQNLFFIDTVISMPMMNLPVRSVVVHVEDATLLISPGSKLNKEQYDPQWSITDIIAPNLFHLAGVPMAAKAYPQATIWGPQGALEKRNDIPWTKTLSEKDWKYKKDFPLVLLEGAPKINESLFINRQTKSLLLTDLGFNLLEIQGLGALF
ncbi:MAG TPA: hypothetical protein PLJ21_13085, partial [Pseudobdellovibrionaceae bacterium]|nr:hypothetical protein [Pseudobdellovibrionaceae bacterium]